MLSGWIQQPKLLKRFRSRYGQAHQWRRLRRFFVSRRTLWILLACLLALHQLLLSLFTQGIDDTVNNLLIWVGALVILLDLPLGWRPRPGKIGMAAASVLVLALLWRSQQIIDSDQAYRLLPLLAGLALVLLAAPLRRITAHGAALLILALPLLMRGLKALIPTEELSLLTARITQALLVLSGLPVEVQGNVVSLEGGSVQIMGPCSGIDIVVQLIMVALIFALAFPMRHRWQNGLMLLAAPILGVVSNGFRIAVLAQINSSAMPGKTWWFEFFHEAEGSVIFGGLGVLVFIWLYDLWMERQLSHLDQA